MTHLFEVHRPSPYQSKEYQYEYPQTRGERERRTSRDDFVRVSMIFRQTVIFELSNTLVQLATFSQTTLLFVIERILSALHENDGEGGHCRAKS